VFVLAQHYGIYERRASAAVVLSTLVAMPLSALLMTVFHP
jgi:predicted permease